MSEPIRTLWFEEVGFLNEPLLDTPIGRLTLRQTVALLAFGILGWFISLPFSDFMIKIVIFGSVFSFGIAFFMRRIKTIPPEKQLLFMLGIKHTTIRRPPTPKKREIDKGFAKPSVPARETTISATLESPVKVVGVLRDPVSGKLLPNKGFDIYVEGKPYSAGVTDEQGFFSVFFIPENYGSFKVEVKPEGVASVAQEITIKVQSRGVEVV